MNVEITGSLREILTDAVREEIDGLASFLNGDIVANIHARFDTDPDFHAVAAKGAIDAIVPVIVREVVGSRRSELLVTESGAMTRAHLEDTAALRLSRVYESTGGVYKQFMEMNRVDLTLAAEQREAQAAGQLRWAGFERDCAALLPDDVATVATIEPSALSRIWADRFPS